MFVCAAVLRVPVNTAPLLPIVDALTVAALIVVPVSAPPKVNPDSVPTDVMFVCAAVLKVPVSTAPLLPIVAA
jgi:hypothetical protein